ncbi:MAG TPA: hypothetical protein VGC45_07950 [Gryllotalpicola sp.]
MQTIIPDSRAAGSTPPPSPRPPFRGIGRRAAALAVAALTLAGVGLAGTQAASAAEGSGASTVSDATFTWGLNGTASAGAYFGGCNFLSAGAAGDNGSSAVWTQTTPSPGYATQAGNVTILKPDASGNYSQPSWATKCKGPDGTTNLTTATNSGTEVQITGGTGTVDPTAGTADIQWTGSFTSVFYGGLVYWSATDPELKVDADGTGTVTATLSGYAASMEDSTLWSPIAPATVTLATLSDVSVTDAGITVTPDYRGVTITPADGGSAQVTDPGTSPDWGSFPQSFIDFQNQTGESSYWYSSGLNDGDKVAAPITVDYALQPSVPVADPKISVTPSTDLKDGDTITVTGTGFDTTTQSPYTHGQAGAYVELGWVQPSGWQPSQGFAATTRSNVGAVWVHDTPTAGAANEAKLNADGSFTVTLTIDADALAAKKLDGAEPAVFTVGAGGTVNAGAESVQLITLQPSDDNGDGGDDDGDGGQGSPASDSETVTATIPESTTTPSGEFSWTIDGSSHAVTLGDAVKSGAYYESTGALVPVVITDTRDNGPAWSISGQVGDFTGGLSGRYLGWTPQLTSAGAGAVAGAAVTPGLTSGNGLTDASTLASATAGHDAGSATAGADLDLQVPATTPAGTYTATLTLTALS